MIDLRELAGLAGERGFDPHVVTSLGRWGYRLVGRPGRVPAGGTRLGGEPDLPDDAEWPCFEWGDDGPLPMMFLGQVCLDELSDAIWPGARSGLLSFFYGCHPRHGLTDRWDAARVLFFPGDTTLVRRTADNPLGRQRRFSELAVEARPVLTLPDDDLPLTEALGLGSWWHYRERPIVERQAHAARGASWLALREDLERLQFPRSSTGDRTPLHQFLGWPWSANDSVLISFATWRVESERDETVDDDALSEQGQRWQLLLAVDDDHRLDYEIGDGGSVLIGVPADDPAAGKYEAAQGVTESG